MKLLSFNDYNKSDKVFEMASELTKLGVPKDLMQFIHKLTGKYSRPWEAPSELNPATGRRDIQFHTYEEPAASKKGPWPAKEDVPLSHDVEVKGTKSGKRQIIHYLTKIVPNEKDSDIRLILVNPTEDTVHYLTRKTGKTAPEQRERKYGERDINKSRELSRFDPTSPVAEKLGYYMRGVTIDLDSGLPMARWEGTIGQLERHMDEDTTLYILETENRVREKRGKRKELKRINEKDFVDYFVNNYSKILSAQGASNAQKLNQQLVQKLSGLSADDITTVLSGPTYQEGQVEIRSGSGESARKIREIIDLKKAIEKDIVSEGDIQIKLWKFLELAFKEGEYEADEKDRNKASLADMVDKHTMPIVASMFLQYVALGKVYKKFFTDDPFKELGLEDLLL